MVTKKKRENISIPFSFSKEQEEKYLIKYENAKTISVNGEDFISVFKNFVRKNPGESFYFLNENELRERVKIFLDYFNRENDFIAYAIKANPLPRIIKVLNESGVKAFDCASIGEIIRVQELCKKNPNIFFNNPSKSINDLESSYEKGIRHFTVDTKSALQKILEKIGNKNDLELAVRINNNIKKASGAVIPLDKFGTDEKNGHEIINEIIKNTQHDVGVSIHVGSQNLKSESHAAHIRYLSKKTKHLSDRVKTFNIGGGMPVFSGNDRISNRRSLNTYLYEVKESLDTYVIPNFSSDLKIILEPGRSLVAPTVDLVISINDIFYKEGNEKILRSNDGIFTSFSDSVFHNWKYPFRILDKNGNEVTGKLQSYSIEGRSCDSRDVIKKVLLPENISDTDYIWVPNAGAYHSSQSTLFNGMKTHNYICYA